MEFLSSLLPGFLGSLAALSSSLYFFLCVLCDSVVRFSGTSPMPAPFLLAIDQGTTSSRAVVYDPSAFRELGSAQQEFTQHYPRPGWVEHDADEIWRTVAEVVPAALAKAGARPEQLAGIGITNQ